MRENFTKKNDSKWVKVEGDKGGLENIEQSVKENWHTVFCIPLDLSPPKM